MSDKSLQTVHRRFITFDPANAEHRAAYWSLRHNGKQDANLRFVLEAPFSGVLAMMQSKIADHYSQPSPADQLAAKRKRA